MVDSDKCITKLTVDDSICGGGVYQDELALGSLRLVPMQFSSNGDRTFYHLMGSKKNHLLLQASLRVFRKRRELVCSCHCGGFQKSLDLYFLFQCFSIKFCVLLKLFKPFGFI